MGPSGTWELILFLQVPQVIKKQPVHGLALETVGLERMSDWSGPVSTSRSP